jgi:hypothetical protein
MKQVLSKPQYKNTQLFIGFIDTDSRENIILSSVFPQFKIKDLNPNFQDIIDFISAFSGD